MFDFVLVIAKDSRCHLAVARNAISSSFLLKIRSHRINYMVADLLISPTCN